MTVDERSLGVRDGTNQQRLHLHRLETWTHFGYPFRVHSETQAMWLVLAQRGQEAWPGIVVDLAAFTRHGEALGVEESNEALERLHVADLWLAFASATHHRAALLVLDRRIAQACAKVAGRMGSASVDEQELAQALREHLLIVATETTRLPRIGRYAGRAPLDAWLWTAARRLALTSFRRRDVVDLITREVLGKFPEAKLGPEQQIAREQSRATIKLAIDRAFAAASLAERNVLRLSLIERLGPDELGAIFGVHRATAARQLAQAKQALRERVERELGAKLGLASAEMGPYLAHAHSLIDVSLERLLAPEA